MPSYPNREKTNNKFCIIFVWLSSYSWRGDISNPGLPGISNIPASPLIETRASRFTGPPVLSPPRMWRGSDSRPLYVSNGVDKALLYIG